MNKRRKLLTTVFMAFCFAMMNISVAYADDAIIDILNQPRFGGAVKWVTWLGGFVDNGFMAVISFVSFFIISTSVLKNVFAGAVCAYPKFWNAVHEAHQMTEAISISSVGSYFKGGGFKNTQIGTVSKFLLGLIPDIQVLTDFDGMQDIDYKQYFFKAIPQCFVMVFIGVFLYNGLHRDVMAVTSRFGVAVTTNALNSIKPEAVLEQLTNIVVNIPYPIKDADYGTDYIADTIFKEVVGYVDDIYTDQNDKANKESMYVALSDTLAKYCAANFAQYNNTDEWKPDINRRGSGIREGTTTFTPYSSSDGMTKVFLVQVPLNTTGVMTGDSITDGVPLNTSVSGINYLWCYVQLTNQGKTSNKVSANINDLTLMVKVNSADGTIGKEVTINSVGDCYIGQGTGSRDYGGLKFQLEQSGDGKVLTFKFDGDAPQLNTPYLGSTIMYNDRDMGNIRISRIIFSTDIDRSVLQCMYNGSNADVTVSYGERLSEVVKEVLQSKSSTTNPNLSTSEDLEEAE